MRIGNSKNNWESILLKWQGADAILWEYQASHKMLTIRLQRLNSKDNLHIICGDASFISGPVKIQNIHLIFECIDIINEMWKITDVNSGFYIMCGLIEIEENVKPIY